MFNIIKKYYLFLLLPVIISANSACAMETPKNHTTGAKAPKSKLSWPDFTLFAVQSCFMGRLIVGEGNKMLNCAGMLGALGVYSSFAYYETCKKYNIPLKSMKHWFGGIKTALDIHAPRSVETQTEIQQHTVGTQTRMEDLD